MRKLHLTILTALLLSICLPAVADIGPPVKISVEGPIKPAVSGEVFESVIIIESQSTFALSNFDISGQGWTGLSLDVDNDVTVSRSGSVRIPFTALPNNDQELMEFSFTLEGRKIVKQFDFSRGNAIRATQSTPTTKIPGSESFAFPGVDLDGLVSPAPDSEGTVYPEEGTGRSDRNIRVYGRFVYQRDDGVTMGCDGATFRIYDEDVGADELLASGATDSDGYYDVTFYWDPCWVCDNQPDIYVEFETANTKVEVEDATWEINYKFETSTTDDYSGSSLNIGWQEPSDEDLHPGLHILTDITRTWRWLNARGYDTPATDVQWPDGATGAWYSSVFEEIHISTGREWNEATHTHEYGHHYINNFATMQTPDYCNGICDTSPTDCGHCIWCQETDHDAWNEGWPNWLADVITRSYEGTYGQAPTTFRDQEDLFTCSGIYDDPLITEGFLGALIRDIEDSTNEDQAWTAGFSDQLNMGTNEILTVTAVDHPLNPMDFLEKFGDRYPSVMEDLWETAKNNGYEIDEADPGEVTNISSSHAIGSDSPDATVNFSWTTASDDASGIEGYGLWISGSVGNPSAEMDIGDVTSYTTEALDPGTYYFNIRSLDRAGNWDNTSASYGPFTIREPEPSNLTFLDRDGWDYQIMPGFEGENTNDETHLPDSLPGNVFGTEWNLLGTNNGETATSTGFYAKIYVDGEYKNQAYWNSINAGGNFRANNWGGMTVKGGRHTFEGRIDDTEIIAETSELDNNLAYQFNWTGYDLEEDVIVSREAPPAKTGGFGSLFLWGFFADYNCDGFRMNSSSWWNAVVMVPDNSEDDYDCYIHDAVDTPVGGFGDNVGHSGRPAGMMDAVLVNRNTQGSIPFDVGVVNSNGGSGDFTIQHVTQSYNIIFGDSISVTMDADEYVYLDEVFVSADDVGPVSLTIQIDPDSGPVYMSWLDKTFATGSLSDATYTAMTDDDGIARLDFEVDESGYYAVMFYRDSASRSAVDIITEVNVTPPDFAPYWAENWYSPLVPRPIDDGTSAEVALPDSLIGNESSTYVNIAVENLGPTGADNLYAPVKIDGNRITTIIYTGFSGGGQSRYNSPNPRYVSGGRHTMTMEIDGDNEVEEINDDNNNYGGQFVWSPLELENGVTHTREMPADKTGGWDVSGAAWYNCDGMRMLDSPSSWWRAVVAVPGDTSDVDVRLHEADYGTTDGFSNNLGYSSWGIGHSDYVLMNYNETPDVEYDVGVLGESGEQDYTLHYVAASYYSYPPVNDDTPVFTVGSGEILALMEYRLPVGHYRVDLKNISGNVNWGLTLHPAGEAFQTKSMAVDGGMAWLNGPGEDETIEFDIDTEDYYCISVWKRGTTDVPLEGQFLLHFGDGVTGVIDGSVPTRTALGNIYPNPFNPQTSISFSMSSEGDARVEVFDVQGKLVRTLVQSVLPAGEHQVVWDGRDNSGRETASGVYMARMTANGVNDMKKMVMLK